MREMMWQWVQEGCVCAYVCAKERNDADDENCFFFVWKNMMLRVLHQFLMEKYISLQLLGFGQIW